MRDLDIKYAKHMVELLYPRMITKAADKTALNAALTTYGNEAQAGKAPDTWRIMLLQRPLPLRCRRIAQPFRPRSTRRA